MDDRRQTKNDPEESWTVMNMQILDKTDWRIKRIQQLEEHIAKLPTIREWEYCQLLNKDFSEQIVKLKEKVERLEDAKYR